MTHQPQAFYVFVLPNGNFFSMSAYAGKNGGVPRIYQALSFPNRPSVSRFRRSHPVAWLAIEVSRATLKRVVYSLEDSR